MSNYTTDAYEALARHLDEAPLGAPYAPQLLSLLRQLFTPEQARVALALEFRPRALEEIAAKAGQEAEELEKVLEAMADKGLVYARRGPRTTFYSLLPLVPGLTETQFMDGVVSEHKQRLARAFAAYHDQGLSKAMADAPLPYGRVVPVGRAVQNTSRVLAHEQASQLVDQQQFLAVTHCYCRQQAELIGTSCEAPKEVCLIFGPFARFAVERSMAREIDKPRALKILEEAEDAGLVHISDNVAKGVNFLCNCCGCCCLFLRTLKRVGPGKAVARAGFVPVVDAEACSGCGECEQACQVQAIELRDTQPVVDEAMCLGCGLCAARCPAEAITMTPREHAPPPGDFGELIARLREGRKSTQGVGKGCNSQKLA